MLGLWNIPACFERDRHGQLSVRSILLLYCITVAMDSGQRSVLYVHTNVKLIQLSENQELSHGDHLKVLKMVETKIPVEKGLLSMNG